MMQVTSCLCFCLFCLLWVYCSFDIHRIVLYWGAVYLEYQVWRCSSSFSHSWSYLFYSFSSHTSSLNYLWFHFPSFLSTHHLHNFVHLCLSVMCFDSKFLLKTTPFTSPPLHIQLFSPSILTFAQAILSAVSTVSWAVMAFCPFSKIPLGTVVNAGVTQQQILCLTAQTVRGIPLAGCAPCGTLLANTDFRKPSGTEQAERGRNEVSLMCYMGACPYTSQESHEEHLGHSTTHSLLYK